MRERGGVSMSMPLVNAEFVFTQPDGTRFRVRGTGDQHHAIFKTLDGYTVVRDQASGYYHYARLSDDGETLVPTGITAATAEPSAPRLKSERATAHDTGRGPAAHVVVAVERECTLIQADSNQSIDDGTDLYPDGENNQLGDATTPNSKWLDGSSSGLDIQNVSSAGPSVTFSS
jgi:hypothetical protein